MTLIFIDTNILEETQLNANSLKLNLLEKYIDKNQFLNKDNTKICIPEIVIKELAKKKREKITESYENYKNSIIKLNKEQIQQHFAVQEILPEKIAQINIETFVHHLENKFKRNFEIIDDDSVTFLSSIKERCLLGKKPFSKDGKKGFRDAIIWETLKHYVNNQDETVIFISKDTDFIERDKNNNLNIAKEIVEELNKQIIVLSDISELDIEIEDNDEKKQEYLNIFNDKELLEILNDNYRELFLEMVYFPQSYDDNDVTHEEEIYDISLKSLIKIDENTDILKFKFNYIDDIKTFISKSSYCVDKFFLGNFQILDSNWNDYVMLVDCFLVLEVTLFIKYDNLNKEILDTDIALCMNCGDMHRLNNCFGKYR